MSHSPEPISRKCQVILKIGPICEDSYEVFKGQRRYAMCRALDLLEKNQVTSLGKGMETAWDEIHAICLYKIGIGGKGLYNK